MLSSIGPIKKKDQRPFQKNPLQRKEMAFVHSAASCCPSVLTLTCFLFLFQSKSARFPTSKLITTSAMKT